MANNVYGAEYRWVILVLSSLGFMITWIVRASYSPLIEEIRASLSLTYSEAGLMMSLFWTGYSLIQIPSGVLSDKMGVRITYSLSLTLTGIFMFLRGSASSLFDLAVYTLITGLTCGFSWAFGTSVIIRWFSHKDRSIALGVFSSSASIGILIALISSPLISSIYGSWRWSFWILSIPAFLSSILMLVFLKDRPQGNDLKFSGNFNDSFSTRETLTKIIKSREFWYLSIVMIGLTLISGGAMTWNPSYLIAIFGVTPTVAGALISISSVISIFSGPSAGFISDRILKRKTPVLFTSIFFVSIAYLLISTIGGGELALSLALIFLGAFFGNMGFGLNTSILADWFHSGIVGTAIGFLNFTSGAGSVIGPWLFGKTLEITDAYALSWITLATVALITSLFTIPLILNERCK